jgi:hypothetical protein
VAGKDNKDPKDLKDANEEAPFGVVKVLGVLIVLYIG